MRMTQALGLLDTGLFFFFSVCVEMVAGFISHEELISCSNRANSNHNNNHNKNPPKSNEYFFGVPTSSNHSSSSLTP